MDIRLPNKKKKTIPSEPKARVADVAKRTHLRPFSAAKAGQRWPTHWPGQRGPIWGESEPVKSRSASTLGKALRISEVAELIGCSPWTVRQTLIPRGLPHFRFKASGRLVFYRDQVIRWIQQQQQGGI